MIVASWLVVGCSGGKKVDVGGSCLLNSDCNQGLVCTWGKCHVACNTSADCPAGQSCVTSSDQSKVCQLPGETYCIYNHDCPSGLICGVDQKCRKQCQVDIDCLSGQICTSAQTCVDPNNNPVVPDAGLGGFGGAPDAGGAGGSADAGVPDAPGAHPDLPIGGTGGASGAGGSGASGGGGSSGSTCPRPAAGGTCNVLPACGCPAGQVCYPDTQATGLKCFTSSGLGLGAACSGTTDFCVTGFGCFGDVCKKYCQLDSDCPMVDSARSCDPTYWDGVNMIPGVSVCSRVCDPVNPQNPRSPLLACPVGFGCKSASTSYPGVSDCELQSGTGTSGTTCSTDGDCAPGFYCGAGDTCIKYCYTVADCPAGMTCVSFSTPNYAGTTQVNYCHTP